MPLPIVDNFDRLNENPLSDGLRWTNGVVGSGESGLYIPSNWLACSRSTTCTAWRNSAQYGPDSESWARIATLPGTANSVRLYVRIQQPGSSAADGYELRTIQQTGTDQVLLERIDNGTIVTRLTILQELAVGDTLLLRAKGTTIEAWRNDGSSWTRIGLITDSTYGAAGYAGIGLRGTTGRLEDFGARTFGVAATAPSAPQNLLATAGNGQVTLTWSAPASDGGSALTGYKVYRSTSSGQEAPPEIASPAGTSYIDTGLQNGTTVYYKVVASNAVGVSSLSNEASATPIAPATAPSAPQNLLATAGNGQVTLTWSAPASDGGSALTGYKVYRSTSSGQEAPPEIASPAGTSYIDTGLQNGTTVYYKVVASNAVGVSSLSNEASATPIAPATAPSAPQNLLATAGNGQVTLTWSAPASDGGSALTGYKVYRSTSSGQEAPPEIASPAGTSYIDTGLQNGTTVYYKVVASNAVGVSSLSNEASATPIAPATAPSAPQNLLATAGNGQVTLTWSAPASDGGSALTGYKVYRSTSSGQEAPPEIASPAGTSYIDTGLQNGTTVYYKVVASNAVGVSSLSNEASATPIAPATAPSAPQNLLATAGNGQVTLTWSAPASDGGSALTGYKVYRSTSSGQEAPPEIASPAGTSYIDTGLQNGTTVYYKVVASNAVGVSSLSNEASATPIAPATAPSAPQNLLATAGNGQVTLTWSAPASDGGSALTGYKVYRSTSSGQEAPPEIASPAGTSYIDTGLQNGTTVYYKVVASNAVGVSSLSNEASATPIAPILPPVEPLPVVDSFNRNENVLSDAGRWSNGIIGSAETGLRVTSNQLASTKTTTCTAWRNNAVYGPDVESWARVTTLPGTGNSFLVYVRLTNAGAGGSGYRLRTLQQTGTDQVFIERIDGGVIVTRLTMSKELAAGDTLLLRAKGQSLEAWHKRGATWTQLGAVSDSTYQAAGRVGVGIRGKTGRLDDFGAR